MGKSLFRSYMPYCVVIDDKTFTMYNRDYNVVFQCKWYKDISSQDIKAIAYKIDNDFPSGMRFWLYNDGCNPEYGEIKNKLNTDNAVNYYVRLSHLLELIDAIE